jgi:hypothetical protein
MHFGNDTKATLGQTLDIVETFNDVNFPGRSTHIQRPGVDTGNLNTELSPVTRMRQGDVAQMEFNIKIGISNPVRIIKPHRNFDHTGAQCGNLVKTTFEELQNILKSQ